jgi:hypothetical protein
MNEGVPTALGLQVVAYLRNVLNAHGVKWATCIEAGADFQEKLNITDWLEDDYGRVYARSTRDVGRTS